MREHLGEGEDGDESWVSNCPWLFRKNRKPIDSALQHLVNSFHEGLLREGLSQKVQAKMGSTSWRSCAEGSG